MQFGDLGSHVRQRQVVIMEPLIFEPPIKSLRLGAARRIGKWQHIADQYTMHDKMLTWINFMGRQYSMPTEVWTFLPDPLFDRFVPAIERVCSDYVSSYQKFNNMREALTVLRSNPDITAVYDGDPERIEYFWHLRGVRCEPGQTP